MAFLLLQHAPIWYTINQMPIIIPKSKRKTAQIQVMLAPKDAQALKQHVKASNTSVSVFLRELIKREVEKCKL